MQQSQPEEMPELPALDSGVTLLQTSDRTPGALHSVVLDHVLAADEPAVWIDSRNNAVTRYMTDLAPNGRILSRIRVARAFTAFQHYSLVDDVSTELSTETAILVLPMVDWFYAEDDLHGGEGEAMLRTVLTHLQDLATAWEIPVLITQSPTSEYESVISEFVDETIECIATRQGPRFISDEFETLVYHHDTYMQTTLAYWREILATRHHEIRQSDPTAEVTPVGPN